MLKKIEEKIENFTKELKFVKKSNGYPRTN